MPAPENRRISKRVMLNLTVVVLAEDVERRQLREEAKTQCVNAHGGLLKMQSELHVGKNFLLNNPKTGMEESCRVVRVDDAGLEFSTVAFEFARPAPKFWPVVFPPADWGPTGSN